MPSKSRCIFLRRNKSKQLLVLCLSEIAVVNVCLRVCGSRDSAENGHRDRAINFVAGALAGQPAPPPAQFARVSFKIRLTARAQRPHCILQPRQPSTSCTVNDCDPEAVTTSRTSWSLSTLHEQTIIEFKSHHHAASRCYEYFNWQGVIDHVGSVVTVVLVRLKSTVRVLRAGQ